MTSLLYLLPKKAFYLLMTINLAVRIVGAKKIIKRITNTKSTQGILTLTSVVCGILVFLLLCLYCIRRLCPNGMNFNAIELDDIRIERLDDIESGLKTNIQVLKDKLAFHRKKKTVVQTERDIKQRIEQRSNQFNEMGRSKFGQSWDEGTVPTRDIVEMTQQEMKELKKEIKTIKQVRKEEEKRDMWALWDDHKQEKDDIPDEKEDYDDEKSSLLNKKSDYKPYRVMNKEQFIDNRSNRSANSTDYSPNKAINHAFNTSNSHQELRPLVNVHKYSSNNTVNNNSRTQNDSNRSFGEAYRSNNNSNIHQKGDNNGNYIPNKGNSNSSAYNNIDTTNISDVYKTQIQRIEVMHAPDHIKAPRKMNNSGGESLQQNDGDEYSLNLNLLNPYGAHKNTPLAPIPARQPPSSGGGSNKLVPKLPIHQLQRPGTTPNKAPPHQTPVLSSQFHDTIKEHNVPSAAQHHQQQLSNRSTANIVVNNALNNANKVRPPPPIGPPPGYVKNASMLVNKNNNISKDK